MEYCSFCKAATERTDEGRMPDGWGKAKGQTIKGECNITFCPAHRKEAEEKINLVFGK